MSNLVEFYEKVWEMLVSEANASPSDTQRGSFMVYFRDPTADSLEFRFGGAFGFGGKFWRNANMHYISYYREDRTKAREALLTKLNEKIKALHIETFGQWG